MTRAAWALLLFGIVGCSDDSTGPGLDPVGAYDLVSVGGDPVPVQLTGSAAIVRGELLLFEGARYEYELTVGDGTGEISAQGDGSFIHDEDQIIFRGDLDVTGRYDGQAVTLPSDDGDFVYRRR